jgi:uncharacterized membrane protein
MVGSLLPSDLVRRSVAKAVTYRVVIMVLDFATIYLFTRTLKVALGFMLASNLYTTLAYYGHERLWTRIRWGLGDPAGPLPPRSG